MGRTVNDITQAMREIAPLDLAAEWDNVGLLLGSESWPVSGALLTIDLTSAVLDEAIKLGVQIIIAYHPPIFSPISRITDQDTRQQIVLNAVRNGIAIYSPHTALDAAPGGINDWLAEGLGKGDVRALKSHDSLPESEQCKVVTFCPAEAVDQVRNALASVGAGRIGNYEVCSFELRGTGTFLGGAGAKPAVGKAGQLERVDEVRLEMVSSRASIPLVVQSIRQFHPYEEPPIEVYALQPRPQRGAGEGRRVVLDRSASLMSLTESIKSHLGVERLRVAMAENAPSRISTIGLCAGAGGSLVDSAVAQGCEVFLTGEMRHHNVLAAQAARCTVVIAGHTNTERGYLSVLKSRLQSMVKDVKYSVSKSDADPLQVF